MSIIIKIDKIKRNRNLLARALFDRSGPFKDRKFLSKKVLKQKRQELREMVSDE